MLSRLLVLSLVAAISTTLFIIALLEFRTRSLRSRTVGRRLLTNDRTNEPEFQKHNVEFEKQKAEQQLSQKNRAFPHVSHDFGKIVAGMGLGSRAGLYFAYFMTKQYFRSKVLIPASSLHFPSNAIF